MPPVLNPMSMRIYAVSAKSNDNAEVMPSVANPTPILEKSTTELQLRGSTEDNSKIIFLISQ